MSQYADQYNNRIRDNRIQGTFGAGQQYLKDRQAANQRNAMYQMMTPRNQRLMQENDTGFKRAMGFPADPVMTFQDTGDTAPNLNYGNMFENGMGNPNFQQYLQWLQQNQGQPTE